MKRKRRKKLHKEWVEFQNQHGLSEADIQLARETGYPLKRFQELLSTDNPEGDASKAQRIKDLCQDWQAKIANRRAEIEAIGAEVIEPKKNKTERTLQHDPKWAEAKQLCRLNMDDILKAKELGLSPHALIKNVPSARQKWKAPVKVWIQELYEKRFGSRGESSKESGSIASDSRRNAEAHSHESIVRDWEENAERDDEENYRFLRSLKFRDYGFDVDEVANELHQTAFQVVDCTRCANCCKTKTPKFDESDVERIAAFLDMDKAEFIDRYLEPNPDNPPYRTRQMPCPFLSDENRCTVYEVRPTVCREYPYTDKPDLVFRTMGVANNALVCPAVFWIVDQMKQQVGKKFQ